MLKGNFSFRFRLTAAIVLVSVGATILGLFYYYEIVSSQIWAQMTGRIKDFGKIGITQFDSKDLAHLEKLDLQLNPQSGGASLTALAEDEKMQIVRKNEFQYIVQKLRHLRSASGKDVVHDLTIAANREGPSDQPLIHRVWIAGVRMHKTAPYYLRVLCADEFEEIDRNNNRRIDPEESIYKIGDIFNGEGQTGIASALTGEISISQGYHKESSGIYITGYTPIKSAAGKIIALLIVDFSAATEFDALFKLKITGYYIIVGVLFLAIIAAATISRILLKPLDDMQLAAARIGQRDFSVRILATGADELAELAFAMNLMALELGEYSVNMEQRIAERTREISEILNGLEQGLITLNQQGIIGAEFSRATTHMLGTEDIAHRKLTSFFGDIALRAAIEKYVALFFGQVSISEQMLEKANPIRQTEFKTSSGEFRHLRFRFVALKKSDQGKPERILVSIIDDSREQHLQQKISDAETEKKSELDAILNVIHIPPLILSRFSEQQQTFLTNGKSIIADFEMIGTEQITVFAGEIHALKGNASQLGFDALAQALHNLEDFFGERIANTSSDLKFLRHQISKHLNAAEVLIVQQQKLTERLKNFAGYNDTTDPSLRLKRLMGFWQSLIEERAARSEIPVECTVKFGEGTENAVHDLHNIIVQLVRNTFAHGIETIEERGKNGKNADLRIQFLVERRGEEIMATYTEDGRGFAGMNNGQTVDIGTLSQKGLTGTHKSVSFEAGRGLGMEYMTNTIKKLNGSGKLSKLNFETRFEFTIPG